jgi:hypothetical protein
MCLPTVYLPWANVLFAAFVAFDEINKLHGIRQAQNSDSRRLRCSLMRCLLAPGDGGV